ncbi:TrkA family potassium uptake protein [Azotosporobacter soli]|uniref:potassium channel family protein n=1 Tax=Azotosporobacter soli TaxID=3055040 RepID=UPI0031FE59DA
MKKKNKQYAVIGLGRFGTSVATTLYEMGYEVLAVDNDENRIQEFSDQVTHVIQADTTDEESLIALGIRNFDVVIVAIGENVQANILTALQVKEMGVPYVVAKASNSLHGKLLQKIGVDRVVYPERDMGKRVAHNLVSNSVLDYIELSPELSIVEVSAPNKLYGKTLMETDLRAKYEINVVAIKRGDELIVSPLPTERFGAEDIIVVVGSRNGIEKLEEMV